MNKLHFLQGLAVGYFAIVIGLAAGLTLSGCALLGKVTPADRAAAYAREAQAAALECKAYKFDRGLGLTDEVPAMAALCK